MSEFNPFAASEEASEQFAAEVSEDGSDSKRNVIALGALAAVAVGAGAFFFLGGSGGDEELEPFVPAAKAPGAAAPAPSASPVVTLPVASKLTLGRNPFRALYVEPAAATGGTTSGGTTTPTTTSGGTTGGTTTPIVVVDGGPAPAPKPAPTSGTGNQPAPAPAPAYSTLQLKGVTAAKDGTNPTGTFVYDGKELKGAPGDVMDGKLLVISIQQDHTGSWFANLQLGDGEPFEVHQRQTVVVS